MTEASDTDGVHLDQETIEAAPKERVEAFMGGVKATSLALMAVLKSKVAVGLLSPELSQRIFEDVGSYLDRAFDGMSDGPSA